jgi:hypothetical protein
MGQTMGGRRAQIKMEDRKPSHALTPPSTPRLGSESYELPAANKICVQRVQHADRWCMECSIDLGVNTKCLIS